MEILGIDVGRDQVKAIAQGKEIVVRSRVGEWRERKLTSGEDYEVEYDRKTYFVHDLADESYCAREMATGSKVHPESLVLFLTALSQVAASQSVSCNIVTGVPINQHDPVNKEQFSRLLSGYHEVKVNDKKYEINVEQVLIVPEGAGAYWDAVLDENGGLRDSWLANRMVRVLDIGSRTVNYCTINNRRYVDRDSGTLNYGIFELHNMNSRPTDAQGEQFSRRIIGDLSKKWMNYDEASDIVLLSGGGSLLLERWLKQQYPMARMAQDPVRANSRGYLKMGVLKWTR